MRQSVIYKCQLALATLGHPRLRMRRGSPPTNVSDRAGQEKGGFVVKSALPSKRRAERKKGDVYKMMIEVFLLRIHAKQQPLHNLGCR